MTLSTTESNQGFVGDGVIVTFAVTYKVLAEGDLDVYLNNVIQASGFTVTLNPDQETVPGADITFDVAPAVDVGINVLREVDLTQETDYQPFDAFPAESHETALDRLTMQTQQLDETLSRVPRSPVDSDLENYDLGTPVANKLMQYKADETGQEASIYTVQELIDNSGGDDIQTTPPSNPKPGDGWWDDETGKPYTWYEDGSSGQWVERVPTPKFADTFNAKLDGYLPTGQFEISPADLDTISVNSSYAVNNVGLVNAPSDYDAVQRGFITTFVQDPVRTTQIIYGKSGVNANKIWIRDNAVGIWSAWKLVVDNGAFPQRLDGYRDTGVVSGPPTNDLNDILIDSAYNFLKSATTNAPDELEATTNCLVQTWMRTATTGVQTCYPMNTAVDNFKMWERHMSGTWGNWKLVVDGGAFPQRLAGYGDSGLHDVTCPLDLDTIVTNSMYRTEAAGMVNGPSDWDATNRAFIQTNVYSANNGMQVLWGRSSGNSYKIWQRGYAGGTWAAWKLVVDGGAFPQRLAGYEDTGLPAFYTDDLNDIAVNSVYNFDQATVTNAPSDMVSNGTIVTMPHFTNDHAVQVIYGLFTQDVYKQWMRSKISGVWGAWKLVVDGNQLDFSNGQMVTNLPTSDPAVSGALWNDGGTVKVSA